MSNRKEIAIGKVMKDFESLSNLVLEQLGTIGKLLGNGENILQEEELVLFLSKEEKIDKLEVKLSDRIINTIVLFQPVAIEIRQIMSAYRIVISLERVGDHAVEISKFMNGIKNVKVYNELSELMNSMLASNVDMLKKSLQSFIQHDKDLALTVLKNDEELDQFNQKMLKKAIDKSKEDSEKKKVILSFINVKEIFDNMERIADHATNIAEASLYYIEGKDLRHVPFYED